MILNSCPNLNKELVRAVTKGGCFNNYKLLTLVSVGWKIFEDDIPVIYNYI